MDIKVYLSVGWDNIYLQAVFFLKLYKLNKPYKNTTT